jgi:hypothetical protein
MSGGASAARSGKGRAVLEVLLAAAGLAVWAAHFGLIYLVNALACERHWAGGQVLGLPWVPLAVAVLTAAALALLWLIFRGARRDMPRGPWDEGGEAEPRFTAWVTAGTAAYSALAVLFQAAPVLMLPGCA